MITKGKTRLLINILGAVFSLILFFIFHFIIQNKVINQYISDIINLILINVILAVSLNLVTGVLGQLVLGHAAFMLVGAYASSLFTMKTEGSLAVSLPISLLLAGLTAAVFGVLIGIPALRLRGDYLAIITLGFGEIVRVLSNNLTSITNGAKGLYGMRSLTSKANPSGMFNLIFWCAVLTVFIVYTYSTSRHGRAVLSIREDEIAAESIGIRTTYYKLVTFTIAAFFAGVAGGLYAHQIGIIDPSKFDFNKSVEILVMVVLGGMGSITGAVIASGILTSLPELLRIFGRNAADFISTTTLPILSSLKATKLMNVLNDFASYRILLYSLILVLVMLFRPKGIMGRGEFSLKKIINKIAGLKGSHKKREGV